MGNENVNDLFTILLNKIDSLGSTRNIYGEVNNNMELSNVLNRLIDELLTFVYISLIATLRGDR